MPTGCHPGIAQQIDIMPTVLNYLGYDKPYIAFGKDLLNTPAEDTWAFYWDFYPQFIKGDYIMLSDNKEVTKVFNYRKDPLLKNNIKGKLPAGVEEDMFRQMCAIIQSYMERMNADNVTVK